ncbi:MAG TPA: DUF6438 domain-containing protein [Longimicrobiales bacterium]|nr:DUF6438 domain-containing protein [Longimicrobiales bacterium]
MKALKLAATALLVAGCSTAANGSAEDADGIASSQEDTRISLQRLPCFGTCPVYTVVITGDGTVTFTGQQHVQTMGTATARIEPSAVAALVKELEDGGYFTFADRYEMDAPACGMYHTDAPRANTTVTTTARTKTILHDFGCGGAPTALRGLEDAIDRVAGTARWIGTP